MNDVVKKTNQFIGEQDWCVPCNHLGNIADDYDSFRNYGMLVLYMYLPSRNCSFLPLSLFFTFRVIVTLTIVFLSYHIFDNVCHWERLSLTDCPPVPIQLTDNEL